jgi:translation initiation factor IF-2
MAKGRRPAGAAPSCIHLSELPGKRADAYGGSAIAILMTITADGTRNDWSSDACRGGRCREPAIATLVVMTLSAAGARGRPRAVEGRRARQRRHALRRPGPDPPHVREPTPARPGPPHPPRAGRGRRAGRACAVHRTPRTCSLRRSRGPSGPGSIPSAGRSRGPTDIPSAGSTRSTSCRTRKGWRPSRPRRTPPPERPPPERRGRDDTGATDARARGAAAAERRRAPLRFRQRVSAVRRRAVADVPGNPRRRGGSGVPSPGPVTPRGRRVAPRGRGRAGGKDRNRRGRPAHGRAGAPPPRPAVRPPRAAGDPPHGPDRLAPERHHMGGWLAAPGRGAPGGHPGIRPGPGPGREPGTGPGPRRLGAGRAGRHGPGLHTGALGARGRGPGRRLARHPRRRAPRAGSRRMDGRAAGGDRRGAPRRTQAVFGTGGRRPPR